MFTIQRNHLVCMTQTLGKLLLILLCFIPAVQYGSSHREAPIIANDPLADNVDVYAFRSPDDPNMITLIATYVPLQLPQGGPNYYNFGENIRYEIHVDNDADRRGDEIVYRFVFKQTNEDPTTFFNIRLGAQNLKMTYDLFKSVDGGRYFTKIIEDGVVPPTNIGPRSIESPVGLASSYEALMQGAILNASTGESVFAGPVDDPFFVDLGGIFDLGDAPRQNGQPRDGLACYNVSALAIQVPIGDLLKDGAPEEPTSILDPNYVIGVWASASRKSIRTFYKGNEIHKGHWVQVSRLGMPLTNEAVIPIGFKDYWNSITPYQELRDTRLDGFFYNPELALYMDDDQFGGAVPAFAPLRIQRNALGAFDFGNGQDGLFGLKGSDAVAGTALDDQIFGSLLLPGPGKPRSVDLWPIFHTGVPNFPPYQLATGKEGNPLAAGKPFINNFLPNGGDMLRLNMAVPPTPRTDENFSSLGIIQAAVLGLLDPNYNTTTDIQFIPNMDGFPNGRRLEDDVTRIELQAVAGAALAAIGLWYDDFDPNTGNPVTDQLLGVLGYTTGVEKNDAAFTNSFPYLAMPWRGTGECGGRLMNDDMDGNGMDDQMIDLELGAMTSNVSPAQYDQFTITLTLSNMGGVTATGVTVSASIPEGLILLNADPSQGNYNRDLERWDVGNIPAGGLVDIQLNLFNTKAGMSIDNFYQVATAMEKDVDSTPGNDIESTADEDDEAIIRLQGTTAIRRSLTDQQSLNGQFSEQIYPIPAVNQLNFAFESEQSFAGSIQIVNALGQVMTEKALDVVNGQNKVEFNVSKWETGMYILQMTYPDGKMVKEQFVVVHE